MGNDPINVLNNCNYSCDERYYGEMSQSCKAGCSFTYNAAVEANQEYQAQQQQFQSLQAAPRSSRMEEIELPRETEPPMIIQQQPQQPQQPLPPFVQLLNRIMPRINTIMQQTFARQLQEDNTAPEHIIQEEEEYTPIVRSFVIPIERRPDVDMSPMSFFGRKQSEDPAPVFSQLFETANKMMQGMPEIPRISSVMNMDVNPFSNFMNMKDGDSTGEIIISRSGPGYHETKHYNLNNGDLIEIDEEETMGNDALSHANPMDMDFNESDVELFNPFEHVQQHQQVVPALEAEEHLASEQPNYIIDPFSIPSEQYVQDPYMSLEFEGMRPNFLEESSNLVEEESPEFRQEPAKEEVATEKEENDMKELVRTIEEEVEKNSVEEAKVESMPIHREFMFEIDNSDIRSLRERLMNYLRWNRERDQPFLSARADYADVSCDSESLPLKDWLACAHLNVGVPRWLTAATIALGIIFSVWLCLVIPSAAPKQKIKSLVIKTQKLSKPSEVAGRELTAAEAKELEATAASKEPIIAVIKVDLPPQYGDVTVSTCTGSESPAPSYKSNMTPGSPAPSYKSIDTPLRTPEKKLEPVHGNESVA